MQNHKIDITVTARIKNTMLLVGVVYGLPIALIGLGVIVDSAAMQWAAFIVWILFLVGVAGRIMKVNDNLTIDQARKRLDEIERGDF